MFAYRWRGYNHNFCAVDSNMLVLDNGLEVGLVLLKVNMLEVWRDDRIVCAKEYYL